MKNARILSLSFAIWAASLLPVLAAPFVELAPQNTLFTGQQAVTATATAIATNTAKNVCLKALSTNTINVYVGTTGVTTATGFELTPGDGFCAPMSNSNLIFVIASTTGASVTYYGTN